MPERMGVIPHPNSSFGLNKETDDAAAASDDDGDNNEWYISNRKQNCIHNLLIALFQYHE